MNWPEPMRFFLGLSPPVRMSGDLRNTPGITLAVNDRNLHAVRGVIIAARHIHMKEADAAVWDLKDGEIISIHVEGEKGGLMENVHVVVNSRCAPDFPGFLVTAAVHAPGGAAPCSFPGLYGIDGREIRRFRSLKNRDSLLKSLDERKP